MTKAKAQKMRVVLPEGTDWHVVVAASELLERDLCDLFILGEPEKVCRSKARSSEPGAWYGAISQPGWCFWDGAAGAVPR